MEQAVWLFVGVVSVIIAIGIVHKTLEGVNENQKFDSVIWAVDKLQSNLNFICKSPIDTRISTEVRLPSGSKTTADNNKVCIMLEDEIRCRFIDCDFITSYELDLNTEIALKSFEVRPYSCIGTRVQNGIIMECQG